MFRAYQGLQHWNKLSHWRSNYGSRHMESKVPYELVGSEGYVIRVVQRTQQAQS
jgi:hypothetical protein